MYRNFVLGSSRDLLLQSLREFSWGDWAEGSFRLTNFSNTHLLSFFSRFRQFHICWLFCSRHSQCARNSVRQFALMSFNLQGMSICCHKTSLPVDVHACGTPGNLSAFPQAIQLTSTMCFCFALHIIIPVVLAACSDKE